MADHLQMVLATALRVRGRVITLITVTTLITLSHTGFPCSRADNSPSSVPLMGAAALRVGLNFESPSSTIHRYMNAHTQIDECSKLLLFQSVAWTSRSPRLGPLSTVALSRVETQEQLQSSVFSLQSSVFSLQSSVFGLRLPQLEPRIAFLPFALCPMQLPSRRCFTNPGFRLARELHSVVVGVSGQ